MDEIKEPIPAEETQSEPEEKDEIQQAIEETISKVRNEAMIYGAKIICSNCIQIMDKHLSKISKASMNDYKRCFKELYSFCSVPLQKSEEETEQNDSEENEE